MEFHVRNVNQALMCGVNALLKKGISQDSRNGSTLEIPEPVLTIYERPQEKVLFNKARDCNPFLHFFEALWILAGRQDVAFLAQFAPNFREYSDNGVTFHAAYGSRLRSGWHFDQIKRAIEHLQGDMESRRTVLQIWDAGADLNVKSKDLPCNTTIYLLVRDGKLNLTTCCRSNDMLWGAYGANAVQFGTLMEYIAGHLGVEVGTFRQLSNSFHVYTDIPTWQRCIEDTTLTPHISCWTENNYSTFDLYQQDLRPYPIMSNPATFDKELGWFMSDMDGEIQPMFPDHALFDNSFFPVVAQPLWQAWKAYKQKDRDNAYRFARECRATDWSRAATDWFDRRKSMQEGA